MSCRYDLDVLLRKIYTLKSPFFRLNVINAPPYISAVPQVGGTPLGAVLRYRDAVTQKWAVGDSNTTIGRWGCIMEVESLEMFLVSFPFVICETIWTH